MFPKITSKIIKDSINPLNVRLTTYVLDYPRFIHAELLTHRVLSRNAASSRAVPVSKRIDAVRQRPACPVHWGENQAGMQASKEVDYMTVTVSKDLWRGAAMKACSSAEALSRMNVHKQVANRVLEPFINIKVIVTATEWENFFALRANKDAQPEFQVLAYGMLGKYIENEPVVREAGQWHLPFIDDSEAVTQEHVQRSVACCARISYENFDGSVDHEKDRLLHDKLLTSGHWSPFEHCARVDCSKAGKSLNFGKGWQSYRSWCEPRKEVNLHKIYEDRPEWVKNALFECQ